jgi:hypothetical protein
MIFRALLLSSLWMAGSAAHAQSQTAETSDDVTMHRSGAGQPDKAGWAAAQSTNGAFSARLPCRFNDFTLDSGKEVVSKVFTIGCARADGSKFSASRLAYREGAAGAQRLFSEARKSSPVLKFDTDTAFSTVEIQENDCGWTRMIRAGQDNILMVVEAEGRACNGLGPLATQFFETVKVGQR